MKPNPLIGVRRMKMPEKHDLLTAILAAKEQGIGAILAFAMAYLRGECGGAFTKTVIDATMCAIVTGSFVTFSFIEDSSNLAYITSVFIATSVLTRLVRLSNASLLKKPE